MEPVSTVPDLTAGIKQLAEDASKLGLHAEARCLRLIYDYMETEQSKASREIEALMKATAR